MEVFNVMEDLFERSIRRRFQNQKFLYEDFGILCGIMDKEDALRNMNDEEMLNKCCKVASVVGHSIIDADDLKAEIESFC